MINGPLVPNEQAAQVRQAFTLRAAGKSYADIESETGIKYSTVRRIVQNRV